MIKPLLMLQSFTQLLFRTPAFSLNKVYNLELPLIFQEGLHISTPEFWAEYEKRPLLSIKEQEKIDETLLKYWIRAGTRCTPFATFSGSVLASMADGTNLVLESNTQHIRSARIDTNYLALIIQELLNISEVKEQVKFLPNNSLYIAHDGYRYATYVVKDNTRLYQLSSIARSEYIAALLHSATDGATICDMVELLTEFADIDNEDAVLFVDELIASQVLISELEPCVTGLEPLDNLVARLKVMSGVDAVLAQLKQVQDKIQQPQEGVSFYQDIERLLKEVAPAVKAPKNTLQVDLFLSARQAHVQKELIDSIASQVADLTVLSRKNNNADLAGFITKFQAQYEDAEIPLAIALDTDLGISYAGVGNDATGGGELIDNLYVAGGMAINGGNFDYIQQFTFNKYHDFIKEKKQQIEITENELKEFKKQAEAFTFPVSMYLFGSLFKQNDILNPQSFIFSVNAFGGPSGANLLGRFTHGNEQLAQFAKDILIEEEGENPDAIYAEVVHLPEARIGNILLRPVLRQYEIPYIGMSAAPKENQIFVEDIMVSVKNGEVILRSKRLNKRIIPRLTTAHNYSSRSLPIYKFLCDLQSQGYYHPNVWDWGNLLNLKHLPRVIYKNLIIKKAQWRVEEKEIKDLPKSKEEYVGYFKLFREKLNMPQRIVYAEGDNELMLDLEDVAHINLLLHYLKKNKTIQLEEFLFTEENCVVTDVNGDPFTNEMIIPIKWTGNKATQTKVIKPPEASQIKRKFMPGSEWTYLKVYCGAKQAEKILKEIILPFIEQGVYKHLFEKFFFIRYKDDVPHLRLRFYNSDIVKQTELQKELFELLQPFVDNGSVDKIQLDTYSRELERYGSGKIEATESFFFYDSIVVLRLLNLFSEPDADRKRLLAALRGIDTLMDDFGLVLADKRDLLKQMQASYFKEFGGKPELQKQLNEKYRAYQKVIPSYLDTKNDMKNNFFEIGRVFKMRSKENTSVVASLLSKMDKKSELFDLLPSYIHMFMNRLFIAQQRKYELVVYHFLEKYYTSAIAISNKTNG